MITNELPMNNFFCDKVRKTSNETHEAANFVAKEVVHW